MTSSLVASANSHGAVAAADTVGQVSVTVVTYNGRSLIAACLESLARAGVPLASVVVVDNASTDGTSEVIRSSFPEVRLLVSERNLGYGAAVNLGARVSTGKYVLVLNQDVVVEPSAVRALVDALEADPQIVVANAKVVLARDPTRVNACGNSMHYTGITVCRGFNRPSAEYEAIEDLQAVSGAAFLARRWVFDELGGFDPRFFLYLEDTDLSLRLARVGGRIILAPDAIVQHDFTLRFAPEKVFWLERNRYMMLLKNLEWRVLLALAPALLLTEVIVCGFAVLQGPRSLMAKLRAYGWLLANLRTIMQERQQIAASQPFLGLPFLDRCARDLELEEVAHPLAGVALQIVNPLFRAWYAIARWFVSR